MLKYSKFAKFNKSVKTDLWFYPFRLLKLELDTANKLMEK